MDWNQYPAMNTQEKEFLANWDHQISIPSG